MPLARAALHLFLMPGRVGMPPACLHLPARCCLVSKPSPACQGGETIRQSPMSHLQHPSQHGASLYHGWHTAAGCSPRAMTHGSSAVFRAALDSVAAQAGGHGRPRSSMWPSTSRTRITVWLCSSSPCLHPAERKNSLVKGTYKALCRVEPAAGFLEARKWGPILYRKATFRRTLRMLICLLGLCVPPCSPLPWGVTCGCASHTRGKEDRALLVTFRPQLQAVAWLPLLPASSEQGRRATWRGKGR